MREEFNRSVFESMPDSVWSGRMPELPGSRERRLRHFRLTAYVAAALSIPLAAATLFLMLDRRNSPSELRADAGSLTYAVNNAVRADIVLPDSTLVTLNSGSTLRLDPDFGRKTRTVSLDGEAYFDVRKDKDHPFYIKSPQGVEVKVTGTRFNMQCYSDSPKFDLTLIQGSVEVTKPNSEVINLVPSQEIVVNRNFHSVSRVEEPSESLEWTRGVLKFEGTPMSEALTRIGRWYGVAFQVEDESVYRTSFTAEFRSETLREVLDLLCITSKLRYEIENDKVLLEPDNK